jgi:hypothetical protein
MPQTTSVPGEATAVAYLAQEVPKARKTLKRTRVVGVILLAVVGAYIGIISHIVVGFFQPKPAAEVASGMLIQHLQNEGPLLAIQIERQIPSLIRQAPDYLIRQLPVFRNDLEQMLTTEYQAYCSSFSKDLGDQVDKMIDDHKAEIKVLLENAGDRAAIRKVLPDFDQVVANFTRNDVDGRALKQHIDEMAVTLKEVEKRMDRLANGGNLTPEEQKARHALAVLAKVIDDNVKTPEVAPLPVAKARK